MLEISIIQNITEFSIIPNNNTPKQVLNGGMNPRPNTYEEL
jgi:hypothetical protein